MKDKSILREDDQSSRFEDPKEFGRWSKIGTPDGDTVMLNSSHTYPLQVRHYVEQVNNLVSQAPVTPLWMEMRPTDFCNQDCVMCGTKDARKLKRAKIDQKRAMELLFEAKESGIKKIRFCGGGEPLLHEGINELIQTTNSLGMGVMLITNGVGLSRENVEVIGTNCHYVRVSVNGGENSYNLVHRTNSKEFFEVLYNLNRVSDIRKSKNLSDKLYLGVTYVVVPENCRDIYSTAVHLKNKGVDGAFFRGATILPKFSELEIKVIEDEKIRCEELKDDNFLIHFAGRITHPQANPPINDTFCYQSILRLYIEADGNASICGKWASTQYHSLGNINRQSLNQVLNGIQRQEHREMPVLHCDGCDSAYFNRAMDFIGKKIKLGYTSFSRIFDDSPAPTIIV